MWTQTWRVQKGTSNLLLRQVSGSGFCLGQHLPLLQHNYDKGGLELPLLSNFSQIKLNQYVSPLWAFASLSSPVLLCTLPVAPSTTWEMLPGRSQHPLFLWIPAQNWSLWHNNKSGSKLWGWQCLALRNVSITPCLLLLIPTCLFLPSFFISCLLRVKFHLGRGGNVAVTHVLCVVP